MKFWPLNPYEKRSDWQTQLSERFSEALTSKFWNEKMYADEAYRNGLKLNYVQPPMILSKISHIIFHLKDSHMKFMGQNEVDNTSVQNCMTGLVKKGKTVFSKVTKKIYLSVSGKQSIDF